jgi:elongation factor G
MAALTSTARAAASVRPRVRNQNPLFFREAFVTQKVPSGPRCAALVGPYLSGKTSVLESLLATAGVIGRKGSIRDGNTVGDSSPEARARQMTTELSVASFDYLGEPWTVIDCPGSVELAQEAYDALMVADVAIVVCEAGVEKALTLAPLMKFINDRDIPHLIFLNKMDTQAGDIRATIETLQGLSDKPLILREIPIQEGDAVTGLVDLVSQRAYNWVESGHSTEIPVPDAVKGWLEEARTTLLESLSDFDDKLLEALLEENVPPPEDIFENATHALQDGHVVPVLFGAAEHDNGITRLLKILRHEAPGIEKTAARLGLEAAGEAAALVFKTLHASHTGKLSMARVLRGEIAEGVILNGERPSGIIRLIGQKQEKLPKATAGDLVAFSRMDSVGTGAMLSPSGALTFEDWPNPLPALYALAVRAEHRADEVKLPGALTKIVDEDPSLSFAANPDTGELILSGMGDQHLQIALDRLKNRFGLTAHSKRPQVPYKETIKKPVSQHARHKKQSGGHGQFGDVHLDIKPLPRGSGFVFTDSITGGVVPKQYIPSVEIGVRDYLSRGPLGFQVVDLQVTLTDGQFHAVDSSDMAFRAAAALGMREGMPKCQPVLLEPVLKVVISVPTDFTSKVQRLVSSRRGQLLGFDAKPGWKGWDEVVAQIPQAETADLINELRSLTLGVGFYTSEFDHLQEISGKIADDVVAARAAELAQ